MLNFFNTRGDPNTDESPDPKTLFQYMSDLHLEVGSKECQQYASFDFSAKAPYLILAGDIGRLIDYDHYLLFLQRQTCRFDRVFWVLGNHEFYSNTYADAILVAEKLESEPALEGKVTLLNKTRYDLPTEGEGGGKGKGKVTVLGCTLWSRLKEEEKYMVGVSVSDFKHIRGGWMVDHHVAAFEKEWDWLQTQIKIVEQEEEDDDERGGGNERRMKRRRRRERKVVVITHHAPSTTQTSAPSRNGSAWSSAFGTDLLEENDGWIRKMLLFSRKKSMVAYWVFGHTHFSTRFERAGIKVLANQRGYVFPTEKARRRRRSLEVGEDEFDPEMVFEV